MLGFHYTAAMMKDRCQECILQKSAFLIFTLYFKVKLECGSLIETTGQNLADERKKGAI